MKLTAGNTTGMPGVYVGIPAHNEEANIGRLLDSIISQNRTNFKLDAVVVACDGCTDSTANVVRMYAKKYPFIRVIDDSLRLGKSIRLNNLFKLAESDIYISLDSDIALANNEVLSSLVRAFDSPKVGLVAGRGIPSRVKNFVARVAETSDNLWYAVREDLNGGNNIHNLMGCVNALSKNLYKTVIIPPGIVAEDEYLFFSAIRAGLEFRFAKTAQVYYWSPQNFKDFFRQSSRFISTKYQLDSYFGGEIREYYRVPLTKKIKALWVTFLNEPFFLPMALIMQILLRIKPVASADNQNGIWTRIETSKNHE